MKISITKKCLTVSDNGKIIFRINVENRPAQEISDEFSRKINNHATYYVSASLFIPISEKKSTEH